MATRGEFGRLGDLGLPHGVAHAAREQWRGGANVLVCCTYMGGSYAVLEELERADFAPVLPSLLEPTDQDTECGCPLTKILSVAAH